MKLFEIQTWPNYLRWILCFPISIIAFLIVYLISYISELRYSGSTFIFLLMIQAIGRPITAYVGIYIVPKSKKIIGYLYCIIFLFDFILNLIKVINDFSMPYLGNAIGILLGTIATLIMINKIGSKAEDKKQKSQNMLDKIQQVGGPLIINGYRNLANKNNCAPTTKTSDQQIIEIYKKVCSSFREASEARNEHLKADYLNTITFKFFQVYESFDELMFEEHLAYEVEKYKAEGLRDEYKHDLKLF